MKDRSCYRHPWRGLLVLCLCLAVLPAWGQEITLTGLYKIKEPEGRLLQPTKDASALAIRRGKQPVATVPGMALHSGDELETGPSTAAQITLSSGHQIIMMPGTRLSLGRLYLYIGEVLVRARGIFHIETSFMTAGVEGTEFLLRARDSGNRVEVIVTEGAVTCRSNAGIWAPVRVAAAEQLQAQAPQAAPAPGGMEDGAVLFRGPGNSEVRKGPARGSELARIQMIGRAVDASRR